MKITVYEKPKWASREHHRSFPITPRIQRRRGNPIALTACMLGIVCWGSATAHGQTARICGDLANGNPAPETPKPILPDFDVEGMSVVRKGEQKTILQKVRDPNIRVQPTPEPEVLAPTAIGSQSQATGEVAVPAGVETFLVMVSATVYDHERTFVSWTVIGQAGKAQEYEAWSNVDFNLLSGFTSYEVEGIQYGLTMGVINASDTPDDRRLLRTAPRFPQGKASFILTKGEIHDRVAVTAMRGLHEIYRQDSRRLREAYRGRELARLAREGNEKASSPVTEEVTIRYWQGARKGGSK